MCVCVCRESHRSSTRTARKHQRIKYLACTEGITIYLCCSVIHLTSPTFFQTQHQLATQNLIVYVSHLVNCASQTECKTKTRCRTHFSCFEKYLSNKNRDNLLITLMKISYSVSSIPLIGFQVIDICCEAL